MEEHDAPLVIVSCDSHIGPTLDQLRPYCPDQHLEAYDAFAAAQDDKFDIWGDVRASIRELDDPLEAAKREEMIDRNLGTDGHTDMDARRADMDADGIAADVIYHSSQNGQPIPFIPGGSLWFNPTGGDLELAAIGTHIYNAWLADACATDPVRHCGVVHLPIWDVEASVAEVRWARAAGLRAVNLPTVRPGIRAYDDPVWEPLWEACAELDMTLNTHVGGAGGPIEIGGPQAMAMLQLERSGWLARRALPRLLFSGAFERHPNLRYVLTEQNGEWWAATMREYDSAYRSYGWQFAEQMPRPPSEYCATNVFIGGSYMAPFEAEMAMRDGYADQIMWGSDYPHAEGTYQFDPDGENSTRLALRYTFAAIDDETRTKMLGTTATRCFGFDAAALAAVAERVAAPTPAEISVPLESTPEWTGSMAFRQIGPYG